MEPILEVVVIGSLFLFAESVNLMVKGRGDGPPPLVDLENHCIEIPHRIFQPLAVPRELSGAI